MAIASTVVNLANVSLPLGVGMALSHGYAYGEAIMGGQNDPMVLPDF